MTRRPFGRLVGKSRSFNAANAEKYRQDVLF